MKFKSLSLILGILVISFSAFAQGFSTSSLPLGQTQKIELNKSKDATMITQSTSQDIVSGIGIMCGAVGIHSENSLYRVFTLSEFDITEQWTVTQLDMGVETALAGGTSGVQPAFFKLYSLDGDFTVDNLTLLGEEEIEIVDGELYLIEHPLVTPIVIPVGTTTLVYEFLLPDGDADGHSFFPGGNAAGETGDVYILAEDCDLTTPSTYASIGYAANHLVMNIWGQVSTTVENLNNNISVYPNPSNGLFNLTVNGTYSLDVIDITGKVIESRIINNNTTVEINNAGMYFLKLTNGTQVSVERVIVK